MTGAHAAGDMLRHHVPKVICCQMTGGEANNRLDHANWSVSKANMVTGLYAGLESGELQIAADLLDMDTFKAHLLDLRRKISAVGHMSFDAKSGTHDDYVTAVGLAWWSSRRPLHGVRKVKLVGH